MIALLATALCQPVFAATVTWSGAAPATSGTVGGTGNWTTSGSNWWTGSAAVAWANGNNDTAAFAGTSGTVTLGANITAGGLWFNTSGYLLNVGSNTLTLGDTTNTISLNSLNSSLTGTISGLVAGSGNFRLDGGVYRGVGISGNNVTSNDGILNLIGSATGGWSGTTTITDNQRLALSGTNRALLSTSAINLVNGRILVTTGTNIDESTLNRISDTAPITVTSGGVLAYAAANTANRLFQETTGTVSLASGQATIQLSNTMTTGTQVLTLANLVRTGNTASVNFASPLGAVPLDATRNRIVVTGAGGATPANQIIGPWATTSSGTGTVGDYVVYDASGNVLPAGIAATDQSTWTVSTQAYTSGTGTSTLNGTRTIAALRLTATSGTALIVGSNANLETYGLLAGSLNSSNTVTGTATGTGVITTPFGGGNLFIAVTTVPSSTQNNPKLTIGAPIADNGVVTVVKTGAGILELTGANTFSGGLVINGGRVMVNGDSNLGATSGGITFAGDGALIFNSTSTIASTRLITINDGVTADFRGGSYTVSGTITGGGSLYVTDVSAQSPATFTGPVNITGAVWLSKGNNPVQFASLVDDPGNGPVIISSNATSNGSEFRWAGGTKTFDDRQFFIQNTARNAISNQGSGALTISRDLGFAGTQTGTIPLTLGSFSNTDSTGFSNEFAGRITNSPIATVSLTKINAGTWILSATNTYTGTTTLTGGELAISSDDNISGTSSPLLFQGGTLKILGTSLTSLNTNRPTTFSGTSATHAFTIGFNIDNAANAFTVSQNVAVATGTGSLAKTGPGTLLLTGTSSYTGNSTITGGVLLLSSTAAVSAAAGRSYTVNAAGAVATGFAIDNTYLQKVVESSAGAIALGTNSSNPLDFNSSAGGTFTAASLGAAGSGTQVYSGTLTPNGTVYRLGGGGGTLNFQSQLTGGRTLVVGGNTAGLGGKVILSNATNDFNGDISVPIGTLEVASMTNRFIAGPLGTGTAISLGSGAASGTFRYVGSTAGSTDRVFDLAGTTGGGGFDSSGTGALTITNLTASGVGNKTLTLAGSSTAANSIGAIPVASGSLSVVKDGPGLWQLTASSTFTGSFTVKNGTIVAAVNAQGGSGAFGAAGTPVVGDTASTATGTAALLTGAGVSIATDGVTVAQAGGTQRVLLGGNHTSGTSTFSSGLPINLGRPVTLVSSGSGVVNFDKIKWRNGTGSGSPTVDVTFGADGFAGTVRLSGTLATTGSIAVRNGTALLSVPNDGVYTLLDGVGTVTVDSGATLGGVGTVAATLGGAGLVAPGNSPGILTAEAVDVSGGLDWAFEFTNTAPVYSGTANVNDILRLTGPSPFLGGVLNGGNVVSLYLPATAGAGGTFTGGFFTDMSTATFNNFLTTVQTGSFVAYYENSGGGIFYGGKEYSLLANQVNVGTTTVSGTTTFASGDTATDGQVTTFTVVVPEPATVALAGLGAAIAAWSLRRRKRQ